MPSATSKRQKSDSCPCSAYLDERLCTNALYDCDLADLTVGSELGDARCHCQSPSGQPTRQRTQLNSHVERMPSAGLPLDLATRAAPSRSAPSECLDVRPSGTASSHPQMLQALRHQVPELWDSRWLGRYLLRSPS